MIFLRVQKHHNMAKAIKETPKVEVKEAAKPAPALTQTVTASANVVVTVTDERLSEKDFLEKILNIQAVGGFGTHLNDLLKTRIKSLK